MAAAQHVSGPARAITTALVLIALAAISWGAVETYRLISRPRRWPRPRKSWLRDFHAEARDRERR